MIHLISPRLDTWPLTRAVCTLRGGLSLPYVPAVLPGQKWTLPLPNLTTPHKKKIKKKMDRKGSSNSRPPKCSPPRAQSALCSGLFKNNQISSKKSDSHKGSLVRTASTPKPCENSVSTIPYSPLFKAFAFFVFATSNF